MDTAKILTELELAPGVTDQVAKALEVYEAVMQVYVATELRYQAAIQAAAPPVNGFASATNGPAE